MKTNALLIKSTYNFILKNKCNYKMNWLNRNLNEVNNITSGLRSITAKYTENTGHWIICNLIIVNNFFPLKIGS